MIILAEDSGPANALCFLSDNQHSRTKKVVSINGPLERSPFWVKNNFFKIREARISFPLCLLDTFRARDAISVCVEKHGLNRTASTVMEREIKFTVERGHLGHRLHADLDF
jgi:hypothetical protein